VTAAAGIRLYGGMIATTGNQDYRSAVSLGNGADLTTGIGSGPGITFHSTVGDSDGTGLTVNADGTAQFDDAVGATGALGYLTVTASGINLDGGAIHTSGVVGHGANGLSDGSQTYNGPVVIGLGTAAAGP